MRDKSLAPAADAAPGSRPADRAAKSVSPAPASIPDAGPWLVATVLTIEETGVVNHAIHDRWVSESPLPCPLGANDAGWGDLWAAGYLALERFRAASGTEAGTAETEDTGSVHDGPVPKADAHD